MLTAISNPTPAKIMATLEDKQQEMDTLQAEFDEYIASSREMEEELEAEMTKCHEDLTKAESRNAALTSQLANLQPQLNSLESKVSALNTQLSSETQRRISAEMKTEQAENKLRETEGALSAMRSIEVRKLKEENEEMCEQIAFVEGEAEECRNELNTEREKYREEMEELRGDLNVMKIRFKEKENELDLMKNDRGDAAVSDEKHVGGNERVQSNGHDASESISVEVTADFLTQPPQSCPKNDDRAEYIQSLEDELEQVTDQLIEAESKLSQTRSELGNALAGSERISIVLEKGNVLKNGANSGESATHTTNGATPESVAVGMNNQHLDKTTELEATIKLLQKENEALKKGLEEASEKACSIINVLENGNVLKNGVNGGESATNTTNGATPENVAVSMNNQHLDKTTELEATIKLLRKENAALKRGLEEAPEKPCCIIC